MMIRNAQPGHAAGKEISHGLGADRTTPLVCSCGCTFAQVREDGALIITSRHHGQKCVNVVTRQDLEELQLGDPTDS